MNNNAALPQITRRGLCLILSSPSGAGKTTLARMLLASDPTVTLSVSATTRARRANETDGVDYIFIQPEEFATLKDAGGLLEWAEVFGNFYGTPSALVHEALSAGRDMIFDIDWQGAKSMAKLLPEDVVRVFILPPSRAELVRRIHGRGTDPASVIEARLAGADQEMSHWPEYDYVIVNRDLNESLAALKAILAAERLKRQRQDLAAFVDALMAARSI